MILYAPHTYKNAKLHTVPIIIGMTRISEESPMPCNESTKLAIRAAAVKIKQSASASRHFLVVNLRTYFMNLDFIFNKPLIIRLTDAVKWSIWQRIGEMRSRKRSVFGAFEYSRLHELLQALTRCRHCTKCARWRAALRQIVPAVVWGYAGGRNCLERQKAECDTSIWNAGSICRCLRFWDWNRRQNAEKSYYKLSIPWMTKIVKRFPDSQGILTYYAEDFVCVSGIIIIFIDKN